MTSACFTCFDLLHAGHTYSPAKKHSASPDIRIVCDRAPRRRHGKRSLHVASLASDEIHTENMQLRDEKIYNVFNVEKFRYTKSYAETNGRAAVITIMTV